MIISHRVTFGNNFHWQPGPSHSTTVIETCLGEHADRGTEKACNKSIKTDLDKIDHNLFILQTLSITPTHLRHVV
jgi:hypothetical protein